MKTQDSSPPVHVHVSEKTPVHVHRMRSPPNKTTSRIRTRETTSDAGLHYPSARSKSRSPWIPPGRVSSRGDVGSYKWQRSTQPFASGSNHGNSGNKEDTEEGYWSCEKRGSKIDRLMMDAGPPKDEPKLRMKDSILGATEEEELVAASKDLNIRSDSAVHHGDIDLLLRTLVEAEIDGVSIANQLSALKDTVDSLPKDKRLSKMDAVSLGRQRELLLEKIEIFDNTNRILRERLREWRDYEKDELTKRVADCEAENNVLLANLNNKEEEATKLAELLEFQKDSVMTTAELSKTLQSSRNDLETQLLMKEAENNHLAAQIQRMEQNYSYQRQELKSLQEELQALRQQREDDRERQSVETIALLKRQAEQAQESARQLTTQLQEKETQLAEAFSASKDWRAHHSKEVAVKSQLEDEITCLKIQVTELTTKLHAEEDKGRAERQELLDQLHNLNTDCTSTKLENQRLKASLASSEETLRFVQSEVLQLKTSVRKHESLVDKYKSKVHQARLESEEHRLRLEAVQKEARDMRGDLEREIEQVRRQLVCRLQDLEPLPERLRHSEAQLREAQEQLALAQGRRNAEQSGALSDLRHKVEQQGTRLETFQHKNVILQEENNLLKENVESLERKLEESTFNNRDTAQVVVVKEATIKGLQQQLEERTSDCSLLSRQLEHALEDSKRQMDESMQRAFSKERCSQSKALDLESQLSIARTELTQLNRSKEEMERRFQCQLKNVKDRLEQSDCTNRSLQNYVHFLKASYGNVFGDSLLTN